MKNLTKKELATVEYLLKGYSHEKISALMGVSEHCVKFHQTNIFKKLSLNTRYELLARYVDWEKFYDEVEALNDKKLSEVINGPQRKQRNMHVPKLPSPQCV